MQKQETINGTYNGILFMGNDGYDYDVPPNYASKSKLLEGDKLKLTILANGQFLYKQLELIKRKFQRAVFKHFDKHYAVVESGGIEYYVISASATYYDLREGDEITITLPKETKSEYAAIAGVIRRKK